MSNGDPVPAMELLSPSAGYDPLRSTFAIWIEKWLNEIRIPLRANLTGFNINVEKVLEQQDFDIRMSWGIMINTANTGGYLPGGTKYWWLIVPAGASITFLCSAFYLAGRALDEVVNPRLRRRND